MGKHICVCWQPVMPWFVWKRKHQACVPCGTVPRQPSDRPVCLSYVWVQTGGAHQSWSGRTVMHPDTSPDGTLPCCGARRSTRLTGTCLTFGGSLLWQKGAAFSAASAACCYTLHILPYICDVPNDRCVPCWVLPGAEIPRWGSPQPGKHLVGWKNAVLYSVKCN